MTPRILALDLSLTATGMAHTSRGTQVIRTTASQEKGKRLAIICDSVLEWCDVDVVVIEGYGYLSLKAVSAGEVGGAVRMELWRVNLPIVEIAPTALKKFTTGKGNADKDVMLASSIRRFGFEGSNNNEADAYQLLQAALHHYTGEPVVPKEFATGLAKVEWPELRSPVL